MSAELDLGMSPRTLLSWMGKQACGLDVLTMSFIFCILMLHLADPGEIAPPGASRFLERVTGIGEHTQGSQQTPGQPLLPLRAIDGGCLHQRVPGLLALPCLLVRSTYRLLRTPL